MRTRYVLSQRFVVRVSSSCVRYSFRRRAFRRLRFRDSFRFSHRDIARPLSLAVRVAPWWERDGMVLPREHNGASFLQARTWVAVCVRALLIRRARWGSRDTCGQEAHQSERASDVT